MVKRTISLLTLSRPTKSIAITLSILLLLVLVSSLVACSSTATPTVGFNQKSTLEQPSGLSAFVVKDFAITPVEVRVGDSVNIIANVTNSSTNAGTYDAVLKVNNAIVISRAVTISAGGTQGFNFVVPTGSPGTYEAAFGGFTGEFTVADNLVVPDNVAKEIQTSTVSNSNSVPNAATGSGAASCCSTPTPTTAPSVPAPVLPKASGGCCGK